MILVGLGLLIAMVAVGVVVKLANLKRPPKSLARLPKWSLYLLLGVQGALLLLCFVVISLIPPASGDDSATEFSGSGDRNGVQLTIAVVVIAVVSIPRLVIWVVQRRSRSSSTRDSKPALRFSPRIALIAASAAAVLVGLVMYNQRS